MVSITETGIYLVTLVSTEQSSMVSLLHDDERYSRLISDLEFHASLADGTQLVGEDRRKLSLADAIAVVDDARRFEVCRTVELHQKVTHHRRQLLNHFLSVWLQPDCCRVPARMCIHTSDHLQCNT